MSESLPSKRISETFTVGFEFLPQLEWLETLSDPSVTVEVFAGLDAVPSDLLAGSASVSGSVVLQDIQAGQGGVIYLLIASATGSSGNLYQITRTLAVLTDDNSFQPGRELVLQGALPNGTVGVAYSYNLQISGGYQPYEFDDIIAGIPPPWMSFNIVGEELVCAGMPDEATTTNYSFTPQVRDGPNNLANDPQIFQIFQILHIVVSGDLPNANIGEAITPYDYVATNGTGVVTFTISSGALPTGLSMSTAGQVTGVPTEGGIFSWVVKGTDSLGIFDTLDDSAQISSGQWWSIDRESVPLNANLYISDDLVTWTTTTRSPHIVTCSIIPPQTISIGHATIFGSSTTCETISDFVAPIATVFGSGASNPGAVNILDNGDLVVLVGSSSDVEGSLSIRVSQDRCLTFTSYSTPRGVGLAALVRLNSGRWIAMEGPNSGDEYFWYTDSTLPNGGWVRGPSSSSSGSGYGQFVTNGSAAALFTNDGRGYRTTNGVIYSTITYPGGRSSVDHNAQLAVGNIFLKNQGIYLKRSSNAGATWNDVAWSGGRMYSMATNGQTIIASASSGLYKSTDIGITWTLLSGTLGDLAGFVRFIA